MAYLAARTNAGTRKRENEDACCIEVGYGPFGEVLMAIVCDGVGGLSRGNVASSTVINRFVTWFEQELPALIEGMDAQAGFDFGLVRAVWGAHLQSLNDLIRAHGAKVGGSLGTTFTGIIACGGRYLAGHVGDCRAYHMNRVFFEQITQDQTLVAKKLAAGEITAEEAARQPKNVILQSVGTERVLKPVFYEGAYAPDSLLVICCDGAYKRAGNEGVKRLFQSLDYHDEAALGAACETLIEQDIAQGEKDNLTVLCFSGDLAGPGEAVAAHAELDAVSMAGAGQAASAGLAADEDDLPTMVESAVADEDDLPTMVESTSDEDDLPTMVEFAADEDDLPTMVESAASEDDLPTMVESTAAGEDDLPTMVESTGSYEDDLPAMVGSAASEDDLPTMVESAAADEDDFPTMVESAVADEDDLPTMVESASDEDDLPTMVESASDPDEDDLPTMVEGCDA